MSASHYLRQRKLNNIQNMKIQVARRVNNLNWKSILNFNTRGYICIKKIITILKCKERKNKGEWRPRLNSLKLYQKLFFCFFSVISLKCNKYFYTQILTDLRLPFYNDYLVIKITFPLIFIWLPVHVYILISTLVHSVRYFHYFFVRKYTVNSRLFLTQYIICRFFSQLQYTHIYKNRFFSLSCFVLDSTNYW